MIGTIQLDEQRCYEARYDPIADTAEIIRVHPDERLNRFVARIVSASTPEAAVRNYGWHVWLDDRDERRIIQQTRDMVISHAV